MKILLTGAKGMLAKDVIRNLKDNNELICTDSDELDITNQEAVLKKVKEIKPNYIINCAAYTAVDKAEEPENYELVRKVNAEGPKNLSIAAKNEDAILVHISTDYVFDGDLNLSQSYKEEDKVNPVSIYGKTKLEGEKLIKQNLDKYYIFRTAWLYGDGNNFVRTILKLAKDKEEVNVVNDQHGSPTFAGDLAKIIKDAIEKKIPFGTYHATNEGFTTWYEFTKKIYELENIKTKVNPVTSEQFIRPAKRPTNSKLDKTKIKNAGIQVPHWEEGLKKYLERENQK